MHLNPSIASLDNNKHSHGLPFNNHDEIDSKQLHQQLEELLLHHCAKHDGIIGTALSYHFKAGGNRTRANLALASAHALRIPADSALAIAAAVEMLHNASLIHDDLQDGDSRRRGCPSVWKLYGKNTALLCGDALINSCYQALSELDNPHLGKLMAVTSQRVQETINGQARDVTIMEQHLATSLTLEECTEVAVAKSGPLLALPLELTFLYAGQSHHAELSAEACMHYAIAYQFLDDINDYRRDESRHAANAMNIIANDIKHHIARYPDIDFLDEAHKNPAINQLAKQKLLRRINSHLHRSQMAISRLPETNAGVLLCAVNSLISKLDEIH